MRLIDADDIHYTRLLSQQGLDMELVPKAVIDNMPSVDAVEVVRCRDCVRWGTGHVFETECIKECQYGHYLVGKNGYCVYGERKLDAEVER